MRIILFSSLFALGFFSHAASAGQFDLEGISERPCNDYSHLVVRLSLGAAFDGFSEEHKIDAMVIWSYLLGASTRFPNLSFEEFSQLFVAQCEERKIFPSTQIVNFWMSDEESN